MADRFRTMAEFQWLPFGNNGSVSTPSACRGVGRASKQFRRHCLTAPAAKPDCQYRCRNRNDIASGTTASNDPVRIRLFGTC